MVNPKYSSRVGPGYDYTPASTPTYAAGQSGGRTKSHSSGGMHYFPAQVAQTPGAAANHYPGRLWIKRHVHTSATFPKLSGGDARPTHNRRA